MLPLILALLACTGSSTAPPEPEPAAEAPAPEPAPAQPAAPEAPPPGRIGGEPILPDPVVVGALSASDVNTVIGGQMDAINGCWLDAKKADPKVKAGKLLVKLAVSKDGTVDNAQLKSTSVRNPPTETCVTELLAKAKFPELTEGTVALVHYPFVFPPQ